MLDLTLHRENLRKTLLKLSFDTTKFEGKHWPGGIYGDNAIVHIIEDDNTEAAIQMLRHVANWFLHPHPTGRRQDEEPDFVSIKIIMALYEKKCYDKLPEDVKDDLKSFYVKNDYRSIYASENHSFMFRVSRLLAAQFYKGEYFVKYEKTAEELYKDDTEYLYEFLNFRAGQGWGEFDSLGYLCEDFIILNTLYSYTDNPILKQKAKMLMDIMFLDMLADSNGAVYGGAHGRSYPGGIMDRTDTEAAWLYSYFFGGKAYRDDIIVSAITCYSDYQPSEIIYEIEENKAFPFENFERKNLHCCDAWYKEIKHDKLALITGSLNKHTYLTEDYILGSVNLQTDYYPGSGDNLGYAHHQQHEWELHFTDNGRVKIFSHHPGETGAHNHWTGDHACSCGSFYTNKNTALAMYNITDKKQHQYINAFCPLPDFADKILEDKYLFLEYGKLYISLYFSEGYRVYEGEGEYKGRELVSDGSQHAVVLRVEYKDKFASLADFANTVKALPVIFDKEAKTVKFDGIELRTDGNSENGRENVYPYSKTYDCYFMQSVWDSRVIEVRSGDKRVVYDFINTKIIG